MNLYETIEKRIKQYQNFQDFLEHFTLLGEFAYITPAQIIELTGKNPIEIFNAGSIKIKLPYFGKERDAEVYITNGKGRNQGNKYINIALKEVPTMTNMGWFASKTVFTQKIRKIAYDNKQRMLVKTDKESKWKEKMADFYTDKPLHQSDILKDLKEFYKKITLKEANNDKERSTRVA